VHGHQIQKEHIPLPPEVMKKADVAMLRSSSCIPIWPLAIFHPPIIVVNKLELIRDINTIDGIVIAAYGALRHMSTRSGCLVIADDSSKSLVVQSVLTVTLNELNFVDEPTYAYIAMSQADRPSPGIFLK
jgi:hypothetical protein